MANNKLSEDIAMQRLIERSECEWIKKADLRLPIAPVKAVKWFLAHGYRQSKLSRIGWVKVENPNEVN